MGAAGACKQGREVRLVEEQIRWTFRLLPKVRCLAAILHSGFSSCWMAHKQRSIVYLLVIDRGLFKKFEMISMVFGIAAGIWKPRHIECSENREAAFAKRVSDWSLGPCPHKNSWRFLPEFRGRSCDARLFCNRRLIICCLLKQWFQKGHWWFRNDTKKKYEGAVARHSEAFWSRPGKETRKTGWSSDSIEK